MDSEYFLHEHRGDERNDFVQVLAREDPKDPGMSSRYQIFNRDDPLCVGEFVFQRGPCKEAGQNGLSEEIFLAILIDRLRGFQRGRLACRENAIVLTKLEEALMWLHKRTQDRQRRGVEGTNQA